MEQLIQAAKMAFRQIKRLFPDLPEKLRQDMWGKPPCKIGDEECDRIEIIFSRGYKDKKFSAWDMFRVNCFVQDLVGQLGSCPLTDRSIIHRESDRAIYVMLEFKEKSAAGFVRQRISNLFEIKAHEQPGISPIVGGACGRMKSAFIFEKS